MKSKYTFSSILFGVLTVIYVAYVNICFNPYSDVTHEYYQVYLSGNKVGMISSSDSLYTLIDKEQESIKKQYGVDKIYPPSGLEIEPIITYKNDLMSATEVYNEIKDVDPFTIEGYEVSVKKDEDVRKFYILNKEDLDVAIDNTVVSFLNEEEYQAYLADKQKPVVDEGVEITNVYFDKEVTIKKTLISTEEEIITNSDDLSIFFLFGTTKLTDKYTVKASDTIESIAYNNELGVEDFLVANPDIVSAKALLAEGQEVTVAAIEPVSNIVVEVFETEHQEISYETKVEYDKTLDASKKYVKQEGKDGLSKVTYATKYMNGVITNSVMVTQEVLSEPVDEIIVYGGKNVVYVGSSTYWAWPTTKPFKLSSYYGYRIDPVYGGQRFHNGIDVIGTPNRNIYAVQSGTVVTSTRAGSMGNYVTIDHHNGYKTQYLHLDTRLVSSGDNVEKGQLIGIMGCTGKCTGRHLHFSVYKNGSGMNPLELYK